MRLLVCRPIRRSIPTIFAASFLFLAAPYGYGVADTCPTPPPENQRYLPLTASPARPWPVPTVRLDHPRLFFDALHLKRFREHWHDRAYQSVVSEYDLDTGFDPVKLALRGLALNDVAVCRTAARTVLGGFKPKINLSSGPPGGFDWSLFGPPEYLYGDAAPLVFDWCYFALTPDMKSRLVGMIDEQNAKREAALNRKFQWHEAHFLGLHAYLMGVLAIANEPGAADRLQKAQNALQNWTEIGNELHGDGAYKTYTYQDTFLIAPAILWSMATGRDVVHDNQFVMHHADFLLRRLSQDGRDFKAGPGDQAADARGMIIRLQNPSALGVLMIADYLRDGSAQWLGQFLLEKQGFGQRWDNPRWLDLIFHDDNLTPVPPSRAGIALARYMPQSGMVDMRSAWSIGEAKAHDIDVWFYLGPATEHAETDAGHFTLWRGDDDLITEGANYLSRPTRYHELWSALSLARNTAVFSPTGSSTPDLDGSELPPATMVYDDGHQFGNVGASCIVASEDQATRDRIAMLSAEAYPVTNRLIWYRQYATYLGRIFDFHDRGDVSVATGDASAAYDPRHVLSYQRSVVDVKPDVFIIRDRFRVRDVDQVRMLFHTRERPQAPGLHVVRGSSTAGILEGRGNGVVITRGDSQATIRLLWPATATIRLVGGPGYEAYRDGENIDASRNAADWLHGQPDFAARIARVTGSWRIEIGDSPAKLDGEFIVAISVGPRGSMSPALTLHRADSNEVVTVRRAGTRDVTIALPMTVEADHGPVCVTN